MAIQLREMSTLLGRHRTTVPSRVRMLLELKEGDRIRYIADEGGRVYIEAAHAKETVLADEADPALGAFLDLLEADIRSHPESLRPYDSGLHERIGALVDGIDVDLDKPLSPHDE